MDDKTTSFNSNATENGRERKKAASTPLPPANGSKHLANARERLAGDQPVGGQLTAERVQPSGSWPPVECRLPAKDQSASSDPVDGRPAGDEPAEDQSASALSASDLSANDLPAERLSRRKRRKAAKAAKRAANPRKYKRRRRIVAASSLSVALAVGTGTAWALNRYVIDHVEISNVKEYEAKQQASASNAAKDYSSSNVKTTVTDSSYTGANGTVKVEQIATGSGNNTVTYYVATVKLTDATALKSAFANNQFGRNITQKTSTIASNNNAIFAINGDYYGFRSSGIVIRNGVVYRDDGARAGLAFYRDGSVKIYDETSTNGQKLVKEGVWNTLSFGPSLVKNGKIVEGIDDVEIDTNFGNHSIQGNQPRTLVGAKKDGTLVFVVVDGRDAGYSRGVTMTEAAKIMLEQGCVTAYNLDGGGSSTMYFNGEVINEPSNGGERGTSDILYVEKLS